MKLKRGSTSVRRLIFIADSSSTTGAGLANLTYNSSGLVAYYFAGDLSNEVAITLATATLGTWTSGGFVAVDNTNMPGWYEIGIPDAALDAGNEVAIQLRGATNMVPVNIYIELDAVDYQTDAFGALKPTTAGRTLDVSAGGEAGIDLANVGSPTTTLNLSGTTIKAVTDAVTAGTVSDKTGYSLANLTVQASTILATGTHNPQSGDAFSRIGAPAGASVSADIAGVLSAVQGINNLSALANIYGSPLLEVPDAGSTDFAFTVVVRDNEGKLVDLDASPTIAAANAAGTSRSANLSAVSHPATGRYTFTYSVASNAAEESLRITVSGAVSAEARYVEWIGAVVDYDTLTTLSSVATQVNAIHGKLPSKSYLAGTNNSDGDIQLSEATGGLPADSITASSYDESTAFPVVSADSGSTRIARTGADSDTLESLSDQLDAINADTAAILLDTGTDGVVVAAGSKTGYSLASTGLDAIAVTAPSGVASTFPAMVVQLWRRFFKRATKTSTQIKTYADDGTTVVTTQTVSDDGTTETQGAAS